MEPSKPPLNSGSLRSLLFYPGIAFVVFWESLVQGRPFFHDDLLIQYFILRDFLRDQLLQGHFPLWNPWLFAGAPFFTDPNSMAAYPLLYVTLPFPTAYGMSVFLFLHMVLAFLGIRSLLRSFGMDEEACQAGALTYGLSGFFISEIVHPPILAAFAWFPWLLGSLERALRQKRAGPAFGAGAAFALIVLSGSFQMSLAAFYAGILYSIVRWSSLGRPSATWKQAAALLWGAAPGILWAIPVWDNLHTSSRAAGPLDYAGFNAIPSLDPKLWTQFLWPKAPMGATVLPYSETADNLGNLGLMAPILVTMGLVVRKEGRWTFLGLGMAGLLLAFGPFLPFQEWACRHLPGFSLLRAPVRYVFLFTLAGSFFAARGFEHLVNAWSAGKPPLARFRNSLILKFLILIWLWAAFNFSVHPGPAANFDYGPQYPFLSQLKDTPDQGRVLLGEHNLYQVRSGSRHYVTRFPVDAASLLGIPTISGYSPLVSYEFERSKSLPMETFLRLWAVDRFLIHEGRPAPPGKVLADNGVSRLSHALGNRPMAWAIRNVTGTRDEEDLWARLNDPKFDPYQKAFIGGAYDKIGLLSEVHVQVRHSYDGPNVLRFQVGTDDEAFLLFSFPYAKEWKAFLDGKPVKVEEADGLLPAVGVPSGAHEVRFEYAPDWVLPLGLLALLWILSLFFLKRILPLG